MSPFSFFRPDQGNRTGKKKCGCSFFEYFLNKWPVIFSIMGEADNIGIIPRFAEELFIRIDSPTVEEVSM